MPESAIFVSDVHLRYGDPAYLAQFVRFLDFAPTVTRSLFIHGDLFDFYVGPRQGARPFYAPLFDALRRVRAAGTTTGLLHGNRDYLTGADFEAAGAALLPDEVKLDLAGRRAHLSHGDQFCLRDVSYQRAKRVLRSPPMKGFVRALPVWAGVAAAKAYRKLSAKKTARLGSTNEGRLASVLPGVRRLLDREAYDYVICGHIHHLAETRVAGDAGEARLFTTGAWEDGPNYLHFDGVELRIRRFDPGAS